MVSIGIDLGTTSVKVCVVDGRETLLERTTRHQADLPDRLGVQDAQKILDAAVKLLREAATVYYRDYGSRGPVRRLRIAGQMHGIVLWKGEGRVTDRLVCSPLYTWMYPNGSWHDLPAPSRPVFAGFGGLTLMQQSADYVSQYEHCGTIMDLFACQLGSLGPVKMSWQLAESWGYCSEGQWDEVLRSKVEGKLRLPAIVEDDQYIVGKILGDTVPELAGLDIYIPLGDLQASIKSVADEGTDSAYLILGTSSQLCAIAPKGTVVDHPTVDRLPYSSDKIILAGRSMNGGNAIDAFLKIVPTWMVQAPSGVCHPVKIDIEHVLSLADRETTPTHVRCIPTFIQERGLAATGASFSGIDHSTTVVQMVQAICTGVIDNLTILFPLERVSALGINRLHLVGNAKKPRFARTLQELCLQNGLDAVEAQNETSAAYGAAIF